MTLFTGLRHADILAGMIVLSAYLPIAETTFGEINRANLSIPVFMGHGTYDPTLPMVLGSKSRDALRDMGVQIEWREYPIPHSVSPKEISDIGNWLKTVLALS
jgi:phospholipase/carboxylesterase